MNNRWDSYFFGVCEAVAKKSSCLSRQIGSILVKDNTIFATAYNGPPRGIHHCDSYQRRMWLYENIEGFKYEWVSDELDVCPRKLLGYKSGEGIGVCIAAHSERNLLNQCSRLGIKSEGSVIYMNAEVLPCKECFLEMIQCGIVGVVCLNATPYNDIRWLLEESNITVREFYL